MTYQGSNLGQPQARQATYPLYHCSGPWTVLSVFPLISSPSFPITSYHTHFLSCGTALLLLNNFPLYWSTASNTEARLISYAKTEAKASLSIVDSPASAASLCPPQSRTLHECFFDSHAVSSPAWNGTSTVSSTVPNLATCLNS